MKEFILLREAAEFALIAFGTACAFWCGRQAIAAILYIFDKSEDFPKEKKEE